VSWRCLLPGTHRHKSALSLCLHALLCAQVSLAHVLCVVVMIVVEWPCVGLWGFTDVRPFNETAYHKSEGRIRGPATATQTLVPVSFDGNSNWNTAVSLPSTFFPEVERLAGPEDGKAVSDPRRDLASSARPDHCTCDCHLSHPLTPSPPHPLTPPPLTL
jgi:hypothetical protein